MGLIRLITEIMILIDTVAIFFQGFFIGRKNYFGLLVTTLTILSVVVLSIIFDGIYVFSDAFSRADISEIIFSLIYVLFWWILGYISSGITVIREKEKYVRKVKNNKVE